MGRKEGGGWGGGGGGGGGGGVKSIAQRYVDIVWIKQYILQKWISIKLSHVTKAWLI